MNAPVLTAQKQHFLTRAADYARRAHQNHITCVLHLEAAGAIATPDAEIEIADLLQDDVDFADHISDLAEGRRVPRAELRDMFERYDHVMRAAIAYRAQRRRT